MSDRRRQFIDTNILVYAHDPSAGGKHEIASNLVASLWRHREGCLSTQVLEEFCAVAVRRKTPALDESGLTDVLGFLGRWRVHKSGVSDIVRALELRREYKISFWDAMIVQSAVALQCSVLWSEDLNSGQVYAGVLVSNPFS